MWFLTRKDEDESCKIRLKVYRFFYTVVILFYTLSAFGVTVNVSSTFVTNLTLEFLKFWDFDQIEPFRRSLFEKNHLKLLKLVID
jgi:hypothetical protein